MSENYFDGWIAEHYDDDPHSNSPAVLDPMVDLLAELAGDGRALEFAIGTGRVALPLRARGIDVCGIELSPAMVDQLRRKPRGAEVDVVVGDMTTTRIEGEFSLVYLVFNTIDNLTTQDAQVACFENAAAHLAPGGQFLIEVHVPDLRRLPPGEHVRAFDVSPKHLGFDEYDCATQYLASHHVFKAGGSWREWSMPFRYVWPAELDLMARIAGMSLQERWENWHRTPFTHESRTHVSVWARLD